MHLQDNRLYKTEGNALELKTPNTAYHLDEDKDKDAEKKEIPWWGEFGMGILPDVIDRFFPKEGNSYSDPFLGNTVGGTAAPTFDTNSNQGVDKLQGKIMGLEATAFY